MKHNRAITLLAALFITLAGYAQQAHEVQRGEDFEIIANKYGVTVDELKAANPESGVCSVGRILIVPEHGVAVERKAPEAKPVEMKLKSAEASDMSSTSAYQVGQVMWKRQRYDLATQYLLDAAKEGDTRAYYPLGDCYSQKNGGCYDAVKAVDYFEKATSGDVDKSDEHYRQACYRLAECYYEGNGTQKDIRKASKYFNEFKNSNTKQLGDRAQQLQKAIASEEKALDKAAKRKK